MLCVHFKTDETCCGLHYNKQKVSKLKSVKEEKKTELKKKKKRRKILQINVWLTYRPRIHISDSSFVRFAQLR